MRMDVLERALREQFSPGRWFVVSECVAWHTDASRGLVAAGRLDRRPLGLRDRRRQGGGSFEYCLRGVGGGNDGAETVKIADVGGAGLHPA